MPATIGPISTFPSAMPCMLIEPSRIESLVTPVSVAPLFCCAILLFSATSAADLSIGRTVVPAVPLSV